MIFNQLRLRTVKNKAKQTQTNKQQPPPPPKQQQQNQLFFFFFFLNHKNRPEICRCCCCLSFPRSVVSFYLSRRRVVTTGSHREEKFRFLKIRRFQIIEDVQERTESMTQPAMVGGAARKLTAFAAPGNNTVFVSYALVDQWDTAAERR